MNAIRGIVAAMSVASLIGGCGGGNGGAGGTVNYNPANGIDQTGPTVNLLITRPGAADVEVQELSGPSAKLSTNFGDPAPNARKDFSVLATAKDLESGIRNLKIIMTRTVCFTGSGAGNNSGPIPPVIRKEANWTNQQQAPTNPSLGETGIIDGRDPATIQMDAANLLVWRNSQGHSETGQGVATKWQMEATNFAGKTTYSDVIFVLAGPVICAALP